MKMVVVLFLRFPHDFNCLIEVYSSCFHTLTDYLIKVTSFAIKRSLIKIAQCVKINY